MTRKKKRRWTGWLLALFACAGLFPLPVRQSDLELAVQTCVTSLQNTSPVFLDWKRQPFYDAEHLSGAGRRWHFLNDTMLSVDPIDFSMSPFSERQHKNMAANWYEQNVLVEISMAPIDRQNQEDNVLRFNVYHGPLAAQGYRVNILRCLIGRFFWYNLEWVS